ncbi:hypothetical protein BJV74DRAFT_799638 [Russula compacta]|nr:hypothetical protein BJV74DRAFT_799638 [Russula compacta]
MGGLKWMEAVGHANVTCGNRGTLLPRGKDGTADRRAGADRLTINRSTWNRRVEKLRSLIGEDPDHAYSTPSRELTPNHWQALALSRNLVQASLPRTSLSTWVKPDILTSEGQPQADSDRRRADLNGGKAARGKKELGVKNQQHRVNEGDL